jgi:hypothetical protein
LKSDAGRCADRIMGWRESVALVARILARVLRRSSARQHPEMGSQHASDQLAALDEQRELSHCQPSRGLVFATQRRVKALTQVNFGALRVGCCPAAVRSRSCPVIIRTRRTT